MTSAPALEPARANAPADVNPYVGLRPFAREDSRLFFGRREQTIALLALLRDSRFLPVVGSSGCGKSSLVRAGLVPALLGGFLVHDRDRWLIATMKPGGAPLGNLAQALLDVEGAEDSGNGAARTTAEALAKRIEADPFAAVSDEIAALTGERKNLLLIVDQFEEIFAFRGDADAEAQAGSQGTGQSRAAQRAEADDFVSLLLELAQTSELLVYVVLTMRSDFAGDCDVFRGLPEAMNRTRYLVPRLRREQLRQAIEGPALLAGVSLAPRLLDRLLNEMGDSDQLPIMQHALLQTWERWHEHEAGAVLEQQHYEATGTLGSALSRHADQVLGAVTPELVALLFKRLSDTDLRGRRVRRATSFGDLRGVAVERGFSVRDVERALEVFQADGRYFVNVAHADGRGERRVDISHESLLRQWPALRDWVDEERAARDELRSLLVQHERHERSGRSAPTLLQEADLAVAMQWKARYPAHPSWARRYTPTGAYEAVVEYIERSERERTRAQRARQRKTWIVGAALLVFALLAAVFGAFALEQAAQSGQAGMLARKAANQAEASQRETARQLAENLSEEGRQALRSGKTQQAARALASSYQLDPLKPQTRLLLPHAIALGSELASAVLRSGSGQSAPVTSAVFSPDGTRVVTAGKDHTPHVWEVPSGRPIAALSGHEDFVNDARFSPRGDQILTRSSDRSARVWDAKTGALIASVVQGEQVVSLTFNADGARILSQGDTGLSVRTLASLEHGVATTKAQSVRLKSSAGELDRASFSADGTKVVAITASPANTVRVW
ncbi:MAG TPA: AAA family ATPase, partial [Polyangiales bacterium]|nr:AAA family ATPase [Polyangiales bacterium]